ncbi:tRNA-uridine aminocarboxypropyltransferase 2-like [Pongo abelii]|uniref:tRNA-uridine aminocarboxypropyltransferase 2-like n=1 Tax=Pongo abelii TaxID=9601 RepID=UPI0030065BE6
MYTYNLFLMSILKYYIEGLTRVSAMESQKEARTLQEPIARPPGASRSQTPKYKEQREGGAVLATAALGAEVDDASVDALWLLQVEPAELRPECSRCSRPQKVCLCPFLPAHPLHISTHLYIIQHPAEEDKMLPAACLPQDKCKAKTGRRFSEERDPELSTVCRKFGTLILYPGAEAANLEEFILDSPVYPLQSSSLMVHGARLKTFFVRIPCSDTPKQVQLKISISSQYVVQMQPINRCLSTLECAPVALSILEKNNYIQETLLRPLKALCSFQV